MAFLRFTLGQRHPESGVEEGLFRLAYALRGDPRVDARDRQLLVENLAWFDKHLSVPGRLNRSRSKGYYRRATKGIAWFRDTAADCISRMYQIKGVLERLGYAITVIQESHVGFVVYEDDFQIVAEPFSETRTGVRG
jgi:hypothetical protein